MSAPADPSTRAEGAPERTFRRQLIEVAAIGCLAVLLLLVLETALRCVERARTGVWPETRVSRFTEQITTALGLYRKHAYLNVAPREGARVEAFGRQASFNSLGYRSPERPRPKPTGVQRILCVGGSTTFDILAASDEASWPWRLEQELRERGHAVEVWNAGFPGWTSLENLISLAIRDRDLEPDWIIVFQGINDLQPASHDPFDRQYEAGHAEIAHRTLGFELEPLAWHQRSLLLEALSDRIWGPSNPWDRVQPEGQRTTNRAEIPPEAVGVFERNLRSMIALADELGAGVVLVPQTVRLRAEYLAEDRALLAQWIPGLDPDDVSAELEKLNRAAMRLALVGGALEGEARESEALADAVLRASPQLETWPDAAWDDAMHFSADGSTRFARAIAELLAPHLEAN